MICKKCGFEYVDGLKECPNCQTPNEPIETKVLSPEQRDEFEGITIDENLRYEQDTSREKKEESSKKYKTYTWSNMNMKKKSSFSSIISLVTFGIIFLGIIFFLGFLILPFLGVLAIVGILYYLFSSIM